MPKEIQKYVVVKTEAETGNELSIVGKPHFSEATCQSIAKNCNLYADAGIHYIVKPF